MGRNEPRMMARPTARLEYLQVAKRLQRIRKDPILEQEVRVVLESRPLVVPLLVLILRYDDVRIFEPGALLRTSSGGNLGERVPFTIDRDGIRKVLYVERGPLGAMTQHRRGPPVLD